MTRRPILGLMEMTSLNVSLPKALKEYIEAQVAEGAYSTPSEYVRELVRDDRERRARERLESAVLEGLNSGPAGDAGAEYWSRKRRDLRERRKPSRVAG
jgi:antitoxin ParD1/3/4